MERKILLAITVAVVVGLIVGTVLGSESRVSCEEWQLEYEQARQEQGTGVFGTINQGPLAERVRDLERQKPDDCELP